MNLWAIFLTGLTTGGISCALVQGGLLAGVISNQRKDRLDAGGSQPRTVKGTLLDHWLPVAMFLSSKLITHTLLGFILGAVGSFISLEMGVRIAFQLLAALLMFAMAGNLLNLHPIFRFVVLQPPRWLWKRIKKKSQARSLFTPAVLGALTIFIPCGVTQVMEVSAIASADPWQGAAIMGVFVLGTVPLFSVIGLTASSLTEFWHQRFTRIAGYLLIAMALYTANGALVVANAPITFERMTQPIRWFFSDERFSGALEVPIVDGVQKVRIIITNEGYEPRYVRVKKDVPVELTLQSTGVYNCALAFVFSEENIRTFLDSVDEQTFTFTPDKVGQFTYACSMGMYSGVLEVVE